ncbi:GFA family protein [Marimonas sp. MJW-29]|uniref:GFA family protein n=1 Tax=Sulfitobacter sediminis TaxID=3234186 RepID=A0ABV3RNJ6_9RHOB
MERRLAAIMATDVVGFAALVDKDEGGTLEQVEHLRRDVIEMLVQANRGRLFKSLGDGFLAEFSSTLEAVKCAIGIQRTMALRKPDPAAVELRLRVGVSVGDVVVQDDDLLGNGVNTAARLEALAEPGGIAISGEVMAQVRGKIDIEFDDAGYKKLKQSDAPLHVYMTRAKRDALGGFMDLDPDAIQNALVTGGCLCGKVRYEINAPALSSGYCHCRICQKFTGSTICAYTAFPASSVRFTGAKPKYFTSSPIARRGFCAVCGSSLVYHMMRPHEAAHLVIFTTSLDNPQDYAPAAHNGMESRVPWFEILDDLPRTRSEDSRVLQEAWSSAGLPDPATWGPCAKVPDIF